MGYLYSNTTLVKVKLSQRDLGEQDATEFKYNTC